MSEMIILFEVHSGLCRIIEDLFQNRRFYEDYDLIFFPKLSSIMSAIFCVVSEYS